MLTAPYTSAMRLGQGFSTYTHEIVVNDAVIIDADNPGGDTYGGDPDSVSQIVTYCTRHVEKLSQVSEAMNISAAASIKTQGFGGGLSGSYVDADKFKESDMNFFCQVKVTNQVIMGKDLLKFNDIPDLRISDPKKFKNVYGDSFISGFIEGGELNAIISVKSSDKQSLRDIKAALEASFGKGGAGASGSVEAKFGLHSEKNISSTETTIQVNWVGGGIIKPKGVKWSIESLVDAAAAFPENVRNTPQRTAAILTKYENLRSFHLLNPPMPKPLNYEIASLYTNDLLDAFMDYKNIWKLIHTLSVAAEFDEIYLSKAKDMVPSGVTQHPDTSAAIDQRVVVANAAVDYMEQTNGDAGSHDDKVRAILASLTKTTTRVSRVAYEASLEGLDRARYDCRVQMGIILDEISEIEDDPKKAQTAGPVTNFLNPAIFRQLVPTSSPKQPPAKPADVAFYDSTRPLPPAVRTWQSNLTLEETRDHMMTAWTGDKDLNNEGEFHQTLLVPAKAPDQKPLPRSSKAMIGSLQAFKGTNCLRGLKLWFRDNSDPVSLGDCSGEGEKPESVPSLDKIVALNIYSSKKSADAKQRTIHAIKVGFRNLSSVALGTEVLATGMTESDMWTTRTHHESWSLKGFWLQTSKTPSDGIIRLGGFYGKDE